MEIADGEQWGLQLPASCGLLPKLAAWSEGGPEEGDVARLVGRGVATTAVGSVGERSNFKKNPTHTQDHGDA